MKLAVYLKRERINAAEFARIAGVDRGVLSRLLRGERTPSLETMRRIAQASGGAITTIDDFVPVQDDAAA